MTTFRNVAACVVVLAAAVYFGRTASLQVLIALAAGATVLVTLQSPQAALLALPPIALFVSFAMSTGTGTSLSAALLYLVALLFAGLLRVILRRGRWQPLPHAVLPLIALNAVMVLSALAGSVPLLPLARTAPLATQLGEIAVFLFSTAALLMAYYAIRDPVWLARFTYTYIIAGGLFVLARLTLPARDVGNFVGIGADGSLFWTWLVAMAFSQAAFNRDIPALLRVGVAVIASGALFIGLVVQLDWTSGWMPGIAAIGAAITIRSLRGAAITFFFGAILGLLKLTSVTEAIYAGDNAYSLDTRLDAWNIMFQLIGLNPVLGLGPANYYWYTPLFPIRGYAVSFNSHNNYLDLLAQAGILGLACFLVFAWLLGLRAWQLRTLAKTGFEEAYVYGAFGGLIGTLVAGSLGDWFLPFVYNIGIVGMRASLPGWIFLGGLLALGRIFSERETSTPPRPHQIGATAYA